MTIPATDVIFSPAGVGAVDRTVQDKLRDTINVADYGAVGDGSWDDTAALQACYNANPGAVIDHGDGKTYIVAGALSLSSGSTYQGTSTLKAKPSTAFPIEGAGALMRGVGVSDVTVSGLRFDAAAAHPNGARYGLFFENGARNVVDGVHVHDTLEAGVVLRGESGSKILRSHLIDCGRDGYPSNHGVMVYSDTASPLENITILGNTIVNAFRKGITTYSNGVGVVREIAIVGNTVSGCGLGGVYASSAGNDFPQLGVSITGNVCSGNYVNILLASVRGGVVSGNTCRDDTGRGGVQIVDSNDFVVSGNLVSQAGLHGIRAFARDATCNNGAITGNTVVRPNRLNEDFGCGIVLESATRVVVSGNVVVDYEALMTYGVTEAGVSVNHNVIGDNNVSGAKTSNYRILGAATSAQTQAGPMMGVSVPVPLNTWHVDGGLTLGEQYVVLANGPNNNVVLPANAGGLYTAGPTTAYQITGIAGGHAGRRLTLFNYTTQDMTLEHNSVSSLEGNRFLIAGLASLDVKAFGACELVYSGIAQAWTVLVTTNP